MVFIFGVPRNRLDTSLERGAEPIGACLGDVR